MNKLINYIENQIDLPFELGKNDCILFVAGAIDVMHDTKLREKYTGLWKTQKEVTEYQKKNPSVSEVLHELDYESVDVNYIQTGNIVIVEQENIRTFGIFTGTKVAMFTEKGLILVKVGTLRVKEVLCHSY